MTSLFRSYWRNTNKLPFLLKELCQGGMVVGPFMLIFVVLPISEWTVNGQRMSYVEFWQSGAGVSVLTFVALITIGTWGMATRKGWSRWALVFVPLLPIVTFPRALIPQPGIAIFSGVLTAVIFYWCLFHINAVKAYFQNDDQTSA